MLLGIGQILEVGFKLLSAFVVGRSPYGMYFLVHNPFPHSIVFYLTQFKFPYQLLFPQHLQTNMQVSS
jgi:hypothetical protein